MKILIVNYYYEPIIDAHAYRWTQLAENLSLNGNTVEIITSKISDVKNYEKLKNLVITRIGWWRLKNLEYNDISELGSVNKCKQIHSFNQIKNIKKIVHHLYRKIYWPDPFWHWFFSLIFELYKRRNKRYDIVVSYYPSMSAHLGVLIFKFFYLKRSKWIADYGDPFSVATEWPPNNALFYSRLNIMLDKIIYSKCNIFAVTNHETSNRYQKIFGESRKMKVIPHLAPEVECVDVKQSKDIVIRYIGSFHSQVRTHHQLFILAKILEGSKNFKYKFELYGPTDYWREIEIPKNILLMGKIDRNNALRLMSTSDVNIVVNNSLDLYTPSKIIECISARRPIINIGGSGVNNNLSLAKYGEMGMCIDFPLKEMHCALEIIDSFLRQAFDRKMIDDDSLNYCLFGHTISDIKKLYELDAIT